jgi:hypothetical protein
MHRKEEQHHTYGKERQQQALTGKEVKSPRLEASSSSS